MSTQTRSTSGILATLLISLIISGALCGCSTPNIQVTVTPGETTSSPGNVAELPETDANNPPADATTTTYPSQAAIDQAGFKEEMLRRGIEENRNNPRFNPYWNVIDFTFTMNRSDPSAPYPDHMRYVYATPEGITESESGIGRITLYPSPAGPSYDIWVMHRTDSEGTPYLRSTANVEGIGIVDIAYYEDFSDSWYIASTGEAISLDTDGVWRPFGDPDAEPWTPYFFG